MSALLDYVDTGVNTFILDGFLRETDVPEYGKKLIPACTRHCWSGESAQLPEAAAVES